MSPTLVNYTHKLEVDEWQQQQQQRSGDGGVEEQEEQEEQVSGAVRAPRSGGARRRVVRVAVAEFRGGEHYEGGL